MIERNRDIFILNYDDNSNCVEKLQELGFKYISQYDLYKNDIISIDMKRKTAIFENIPTRNNYVHGTWNMFISYLEDISADLDYPEYNYTIDYLESLREDESDLKNESKEDIIEHPNHYNSYSLETIEAIKGQSTVEEFRGYLKGNIMKYISRYQFKNGAQDLHKAEWYLKRLIEEVEENE